MTNITRFAPSPTGLLHIGHVYSAQFAKAEARRLDGRFLLRIETIDIGRCRTEFETAIAEDLAWLGLKWEKPVRRQSEHMGDYRRALNELERLGLLYPCFCTRKEIIAEIEAAGHAPHEIPPGQAGPFYPGTCRDLDTGERDERIGAGGGERCSLPARSIQDPENFQATRQMHDCRGPGRRQDEQRLSQGPVEESA